MGEAKRRGPDRFEHPKGKPSRWRGVLRKLLGKKKLEKRQALISKRDRAKKRSALRRSRGMGRRDSDRLDQLMRRETTRINDGRTREDVS